MRRYRGDNFPFSATIKLNGQKVDLTGADVKFSYKEGTIVRTILARYDDPTSGVAIFEPSLEDFQKVGTFEYDVQRIQDGFTYTHMRDKIIIEKDIS
jgi:hypothetical protein